MGSDLNDFEMELVFLLQFTAKMGGICRKTSPFRRCSIQLHSLILGILRSVEKFDSTEEHTLLESCPSTALINFVLRIYKFVSVLEN